MERHSNPSTNNQHDHVKYRELLKSGAAGWILAGILITLILGYSLIEFSLSLAPLNEGETWWSFYLRNIGLSFLGFAITSGVGYLVVVTFYEQFQAKSQEFVDGLVTGKLDEIQQHVLGQTNTLHDSFASLSVLQGAGIQRVYASRDDASEDFVQALEASGVSEIRIASISLNDFISLGLPWKIIRNYITGSSQPKSGHLKIKILLIHPDCLGALLRSKAESRLEPELLHKLEGDVRGVIKQLAELHQQYHRDDNTVEFDFHLYTTPPILSLFGTNEVSFVHPFYFWPARNTSKCIPVMVCPEEEASRSISLHQGMQYHFDWVWDHASIPFSDFVTAHVVGLDRGLFESHAVNVFANSFQSRQRMRWLIGTAKEHIDIMGVALREFVQSGDLQQAIQEAIAKGVKVRILLLNQTCEQAHYWSFREYCLTSEQIPFDNYKDHEKSSLFLQIGHSLELVKKIKQVVTNRGKQDYFEAKVYSCAPFCFMLRADSNMLVKTYHYGSNVTGDYTAGSDLPQIEYTRTAPKLLADNTDGQNNNNPFTLLSNHFNFVFEKCSQPIDYQ